MILALETATASCSAALCAADGTIVAERVSRQGSAHSRLLLPEVHEILEEAEADWGDIDTVAVSLGPGAFTGLRIGIATARALAQADGGVRLIGVPTLSALALALAHTSEAAGLSGSLRLVPLVDGRRGEVFAAVFDGYGVGVKMAEQASVVGSCDLGDWLRARGDVLVGGDGAVLYAAVLPASARLAGGIVAPTAAMVGRAAACGSPGIVAGPAAVAPIYGRAPDAKPWSPPPAAGRVAS